MSAEDLIGFVVVTCCVVGGVDVVVVVVIVDGEHWKPIILNSTVGCLYFPKQYLTQPMDSIQLLFSYAQRLEIILMIILSAPASISDSFNLVTSKISYSFFIVKFFLIHACYQ